MTIEYVEDRPTVVVTGRVGPVVVNDVARTIRGLSGVGVVELTVDLSGSRDVAELLVELARTRAELVAQGGALVVVGVTRGRHTSVLSRDGQEPL